MGLAFLLETAYLLPLTAITLLVAVAALGFRATGRRGYGPFAVGLVAAVLVVVGKFVSESSFLTYGGIALLIAASVWNSWPKKRARCDLVELGVNSETLKRKGDE
jgi:hypothetical protein